MTTPKATSRRQYHTQRPHHTRRRRITTIPAACVKAMEALRKEEMPVQALQDRFV